MQANSQDIIKSLEKKLDRIERKLMVLIEDKRKPKETWVKASTIQDLTGWTKEDMRRARNSGTIKYKKEDGFFYLLESLSPVLIKSQHQ